MGIESISISFSGATTGYATYSPGDTIQGVLRLTISGHEPHKLSSLLVKIRGLAKTAWKNSSGSGKNRRTHRHSEELWLIREDIFFIRGPTVEGLHPGTYQYPFSYTLRRGLPPTFSTQFGEISYLCKARAISHDLFSFNGKSEYKFTVLAHLDLNSEPSHLARPVRIQREAETSFFGHRIGEYVLTMSHQLCVAGQRINFTIEGPDRLFEKLASANGVIKLKRRILCVAHNHQREMKSDVAMVSPGTSKASWRQFGLVVPNNQGITISESMCRIITLSYYIKVKASYITLSLPVVLGNVQLAAAAAASAPPRSWLGSPVPSAPVMPLRSAPAAEQPHWLSASHDRRRRSGGSPAATWGRAPASTSASASAAAATPAPEYDPPPSYEQVMRDGGHRGSPSDYLSQVQGRRRKADEAAGGFTHLGDM